jgi:AAA+ ATPase superfamily predicted ATPase
MLKIPFSYGRVVDAPFFVNRVDELIRLESNFASGINTVIISPRRWGKSSLVNMASKRLISSDSEFIVCTLDLFNIRTEKEFYEALIRTVLRASSSKWEEAIQLGKKFLSSIIPTFSLGIDPERDFTVSFDLGEKSHNIDDILNLPERVAKAKNKKLVICIDEFQNLTTYTDPLAFQKRLRSVWQNQKNVTYCLYGSKRHMITDIFENKSMPFYKFGDLMFLNKISNEHWTDFIYTAFRSTSKKVSRDIASEISIAMQCHPYFVQQLAQKVWTLADTEADHQTLTIAINHLLYENAILYHRELEGLTNTQINFLKAVCDGVKQLSSSETLSTYGLGTSANVLRVKTALESKEILDLMNGYPEFIDPLFERWMKEIYFKR